MTLEQMELILKSQEAKLAQIFAAQNQLRKERSRQRAAIRKTKKDIAVLNGGVQPSWRTATAQEMIDAKI